MSFLPRHFVRTDALVNSSSIHWVETKLSGRYYIGPAGDDSIIHTFLDQVFYFEDHKEAMLYELVWAGR